MSGFLKLYIYIVVQYNEEMCNLKKYLHQFIIDGLKITDIS